MTFGGTILAGWLSSTTSKAATELEVRAGKWVRHRPLVQRQWASMASRAAAKNAPQGSGLLLPTIHRHAGVGHRVSSWISAFCFAKMHGLQLLYAPWRDDWASFLGIDSDPPWTPSLGPTVLLPPLSDERNVEANLAYRKIVQSGAGRNIVYRLPMDHHRHDQSPAFEEVRARYRLLHPRITSDDFRISVHIRRGDVNAAMVQRFRGEDYFDRQVAEVLDVLEKLDIAPHVTVHGQGKRPELSSLREAKVRYDLDGDPFMTFAALCDADLIIASPSSFSVTAAMIAQAVVLRPVNWYHAMPLDSRWIGVAEDGRTEPGAVLRSVREHLGSRIH